MAITSQDTVAEFVHTVFPFTTTDKWRAAEYKKARDFVNAALKYHPDRNSSPNATKAFKAARAAYEYLSKHAAA